MSVRAAFLRARRIRNLGLLSGSDEFVGVFGGLPLKFGDARQQHLVLLDETADLRQQGQYEPLQIVGVERIDPLGRHPELESNDSDALNIYESQRRRR